MNSRKGISPIIASVLLLAVSLAVVGIFSGWAPELAQDVTQETRNNTFETISCNEAAVEIRSAYFDGSDVILSVRNTGTEDLSNLTLVAYNENNQILGRGYTAIERGEISEETVNSGEEPSYVEALSQNCGSVTYRIDDIST